MSIFRHMVVLGSTRFSEQTKTTLLTCALEVRYDASVPADDAELARKVGDADALLVSPEVCVGAEAIAACPSLRYIGLCCGLHSPESANVDIHSAKARGIAVTGIQDYGDEGAVEYVISELVRLLHGFGTVQWRSEPRELSGVSCAVLGMGALGTRISQALQFFGAEVAYFSRTRKPEVECKGVRYMPLGGLLSSSDICVSCLNAGPILLNEEALHRFGNGKILMNIATGPCADTTALAGWLADPSNYYLCDTVSALGDASLLSRANVLCLRRSAGLSVQSNLRYNEKVLANVRDYLRGVD